MPRIIEDPTYAVKSIAKEILYDQNRGLNAINMRDIAKQCGIGLGTIYNYIPDKETLIRMLMVDYWDEFLILIDQLLQSEQNFYLTIEQLYIKFGEFVQYFHEIFISTKSNTKLVHEEEEMSTRNTYMVRLKIQITNYTKRKSANNLTITPDELTEFILSNFMAMSYYSHYTYSVFEKILKSLLE